MKKILVIFMIILCSCEKEVINDIPLPDNICFKIYYYKQHEEYYVKLVDVNTGAENYLKTWLITGNVLTDPLMEHADKYKSREDAIKLINKYKIQEYTTIKHKIYSNPEIEDICNKK